MPIISRSWPAPCFDLSQIHNMKLNRNSFKLPTNEGNKSKSLRKELPGIEQSANVKKMACFFSTSHPWLGWQVCLLYVVDAHVFSWGVNSVCSQLITGTFWKTELRGHYLFGFLLPPQSPQSQWCPSLLVIHTLY